jgi:hypothetical protein
MCGISTIITDENKMNEKLEIHFKEQISKLSKDRQEAINSFDWLKKCQEIGEKYGLQDDDYLPDFDVLKTEVALAITGLHDLTTLHRAIDDKLALNAREITNDVSENILKPISEIRQIILKHNAF